MKHLLGLMVAIIPFAASAGEFCDGQRPSSSSAVYLTSSSGYLTTCQGCVSVSSGSYSSESCPYDPALNEAIRQQLSGRLAKKTDEMNEGELYEFNKEITRIDDWSSNKTKYDKRLAEKCRQKAYQAFVSILRNKVSERCANIKIKEDAALIAPTLPDLPK